MLTGSHTLQVKRNYQHAAAMTGSAQNRVLVPFDFCPHQVNGNIAV